MAKKNDIRKYRKVKSVTWMPIWALKLKGRWDSAHGEGVCDGYINCLNRKRAFLEGDEVIAVENELFHARKEAAVILSGLSEQKLQLLELPEQKAGDSVEVIRENRKNADRQGAARAKIKNSIENLTMIDETIIHVESVLDERIHMIRSNMREKVNAYMIGIRCGELKDYTEQASEFDDTSRELYKSKHEELDCKIREIVKECSAMVVEEV